MRQDVTTLTHSNTRRLARTPPAWLAHRRHAIATRDLGGADRVRHGRCARRNAGAQRDAKVAVVKHDVIAACLRTLLERDTHGTSRNGLVDLRPVTWYGASAIVEAIHQLETALTAARVEIAALRARVDELEQGPTRCVHGVSLAEPCYGCAADGT